MTGAPQVRLGDVVEIRREIVEPAAIPSGTLYVGLEHIEIGGRFVNVGCVNAGDLASAKFAFTSEHVLYGKLRPYLAKIAAPHFAGICSTDILPLQPGSKVDRNYLRWLLLSPPMVARANSRASGANLPRLSPSALEDLTIPLPPLSKQRRIAATLDRADALRARRRAALAQLDILRQAIFLDIFGDPITNPKGWPRRALGELGSLDRGVSKHRPRNAPELLGGPYPFVQTGDIARCDGWVRGYGSTYSEAGLRQSRLWPAGTLCITIAANIAMTGILTFDGCFPDSVVGFQAADVATVIFIREWLRFIQASLEDAAPESAQKNINLKVLRNLEVPTPPIELQRQFTRRIDAGRRLAEQSARQAEELDSLFASLQHRAFRGDL